MILLIVSSRRGVGRMQWMEQPTILRWISKRLFPSLALEPPELRLRPGLSWGTATTPQAQWNSKSDRVQKPEPGISHRERRKIG